MHSLLRISCIFAILASLFLIYAIKAGSVRPSIAGENVDPKNCSPAGAVCGEGPPCCNPRCRVNWGGAWCT